MPVERRVRRHLRVSRASLMLRLEHCLMHELLSLQCQCLALITLQRRLVLLRADHCRPFAVLIAPYQFIMLEGNLVAFEVACFIHNYVLICCVNAFLLDRLKVPMILLVLIVDSQVVNLVIRCFLRRHL